MKIAYFSSDLFMQCLEVFHEHHHEIVAIFAADSAENCKDIQQYASQKNIQYFTGKPQKIQIQQLENEGVSCFFSIEYDSLIPLPSSKVKTINMHPTMLPEGRGITPLSHLILQYPQHAGITFHKLAEQFDEGDIILQSPIQLDEHEGLESLLVKLNFKIPELLNRLLSDLPNLYQQAKPQGKGSYWPKLTDQDRMLNWSANTADISRMIRAFGQFGVVCCIGHEIWLVNHIETHTTQHSSPGGTLLSEDNKTCVVAVADGIVIIYKDGIIQRRELNPV
ncbi:MAG: hypothetical protein HN349_01855 [Gammaproteobacteria bacterium]|jgi:methionyl-tRNA formyltransferase|nr:hypothetical protein [Gammaproteobacteria bacterium]MBT4193927.1 hypothetical protein [Gammaproteobacteria bacterium]MBT6456784.1 hypothetical protein [Gammaproteobacteria bacterium]MBT7047882.1 hypothetical protein [Gammaproteobacteria bacterium]